MKILITGTHFTPAHAVIEEFKKMPDVELVYIGRSSTLEGDKAQSMESQVLSNLEVKFLPLMSGRVQRSFTRYTIPALLRIPIGFLQALFYLFKEKPDVVLSFGGYISVPVVIGAWLLSIPVITHEQTLVSGLANTVNSWFASKTAISFLENKSFNKKNVVFTGNPLRSEIVNPTKPEDEELIKIINLARKDKTPILLITGGNQGSHIINKVVSESLDKLLNGFFIIHQTGDSKFKDFDKLSEQKKMLNHSEKYIVRKWIDSKDWGFLLKNTDLAVSRAGINSLLEFAYFSIPTVAIPLPFIYKDEQNINANFFAKAGLVKILYQSKLNKETLVKNLNDVFLNLEEYKKSFKNVKDFVIEDAAKRLALETILLVKTMQ